MFNEIPVVFYNGLNYDYYFMTKKKLANDFKGQTGMSWGKRRKV